MPVDPADPAEERADAERADAAVGWTVHRLGLSPLLAGPAAAALVSPSVGSGDGWSSVFLSTLAFAAGVAAFVVVLRTRAFGELVGWPLVGVAGFCLLGGFVLGGWLSMSAFTTQPVPTSGTGTPFDLPATFVLAAIDSWGVVGALLSGCAGVAAGMWGVRRAT